MSDSRKEGIDKLKKAKISHQNLTKEELQKVYASLVEENFPDSKRIHFIADLGRSPEIAFHFELICNDWEEGTDTQLFSKSNLVHCLLTVDFKTFFSSPRITS